jgi:hypothetical protein
MTFLLLALRRRKRLLAPLRALHYRLWRMFGVSGVTQISPELRELARIVRRSAREELPASDGGQRILFFTFRAWNTHVIADALTAQALRQRGATVRFFTCGARLPICDVTAHTMAPPMPCSTCAPYVEQVLSVLRLPCDEMRDFITPAERAEIVREVHALTSDQFESYELDGLPVGQLVRPSLQWFLLSGSLVLDREALDTYRKFLVSGGIMVRVTARMLDTIKPDKLYLLNGIFFAERIAIEQARLRGIPFITHEGGFMPDTQVFAHDGFAPHYDLDDTWAVWSQRPLTDSEDHILDQYLDERARGGKDVSAYYPSIESDVSAVARQLGLDRGRPIGSLFTNVDWDTACFAAGSAFDSMEQWLVHTIRYFMRHSDLQLVVRAHPAEVRLPLLEPREGVVAMIRRHFAELPPNVALVPPDSNVSSYALMDLSDFGLIYTSTTGMEMVLRGKQVVGAGRAYYANKGFTLDAASPEEYDQLIDRARREPLSPEQLVSARRYASLFFFRHHIRFPLTTTRRGRIRFNFQDLTALRPGREPLLDLVCDGILHGRPFFRTGTL